MMACIASFCAGASIVLVIVMLRMTRRKRRSITMHARRGQHEFVQRRWRDSKSPCIACHGGDLPCVCRRDQKSPVVAEVGGIDYRFMGVGNEMD